MRHFCNICNRYISTDIFSDTERNVGWMIFKFRRIHKFPERNHQCLFIWNLDSDCRLSRDWCLNPDICRREIQFDIIGKIHDLTYFDAHFRLDLITCDRWSAADICDRNVNAEIL